MNSLFGAYDSDQDDLGDDFSPKALLCKKCKSLHPSSQFRTKDQICSGCDGSAIKSMLPLSSSMVGVDSEEENDDNSVDYDMSAVDMTIKPRAVITKESIQLPFSIHGVCYTLKSKGHIIIFDNASKLKPAKYDPPGGDKTLAMDMDTGWYKYADESDDEDSDENVVASASSDDDDDSDASSVSDSEPLQAHDPHNMPKENKLEDDGEEYDDGPPPPPPTGTTAEEQKQAQSLWGANATAVNMNVTAYTEFKKDFNKRSNKSFTKSLGGNNVMFASLTFGEKPTQVKYFVNTHVQKNIPLLHKSILYGARYNRSNKLLYLSMCWYRRPNQTYMFVFTLLRTKCTAPNDEYIYMDEKTQRIRWITDLNTLKSCEPDLAKPFDVVKMTDKLCAYLDEKKKFHDPLRGPNLKENGYVEDTIPSRERRKPDPPSPPNYRSSSTNRTVAKETISDTPAGRGGRSGRAARGGRAARVARGGRGAGGRENKNRDEDEVKSAPMPQAATGSKRKNQMQDADCKTNDAIPRDDNVEFVQKKFKEVDVTENDFKKDFEALYLRLNSMATEHSKEMERLEEKRMKDIALLLEKQSALEREVSYYQETSKATASASTTSPQSNRDTTPLPAPRHIPSAQATCQQFALSQNAPLNNISGEAVAQQFAQHQIPQQQNTPFASFQTVPQMIAPPHQQFAPQQTIPHFGLSLSQYVANLRSLSMRGDERNLLLNVLRERDILESSIATFGNLTFPSPK